MDQCSRGYPKNLMQGEEIEKSFLATLEKKLLNIGPHFHFRVFF